MKITDTTDGIINSEVFLKQLKQDLINNPLIFTGDKKVNKIELSKLIETWRTINGGFTDCTTKFNVVRKSIEDYYSINEGDSVQMSSVLIKYLEAPEDCFRSFVINKESRDHQERIKKDQTNNTP